ncbi:CDP-alcohol phosphatidyltransferase family protein [Paenibacillus koleovorans]|uniref:CDP-alcohol phosphatidyltransferase family protein n=1 Tax=Paenibacillus koleovorans TaxID=121608 RepID=UPI000FDAED3B|nr:CDP-alcohol phosphatidyltransferase family protein [Paenibacillus koleovorans]
MNLPNLLTLCRFALIPVYIVFYSLGHIKTAFAIVVLAGATDVLDGYLARKRGQITPIGIMLDPLADKCMMVTVVVSLLVTGRIPWEAAVAMLFRDAGMIIGSAFFHFRGKRTVPANTMGKVATVLYYLAFLFVFFDQSLGIAILWSAIGLSFLASFVYIFLFKSINQETQSHDNQG